MQRPGLRAAVHGRRGAMRGRCAHRSPVRTLACCLNSDAPTQRSEHLHCDTRTQASFGHSVLHASRGSIDARETTACLPSAGIRNRQHRPVHRRGIPDPACSVARSRALSARPNAARAMRDEEVRQAFNAMRPLVAQSKARLRDGDYDAWPDRCRRHGGTTRNMPPRGLLQVPPADNFAA